MVTQAEKLTIWIQFEITRPVAAIKSLRFALFIEILLKFVPTSPIQGSEDGTVNWCMYSLLGHLRELTIYHQ